MCLLFIIHTLFQCVSAFQSTTGQKFSVFDNFTGFQFEDSLIFSTENSISLMKCMSACNADANCVSFTYNPVTCRIHSAHLCPSAQRTSSPGTLYYYKSHRTGADDCSRPIRAADCNDIYDHCSKYSGIYTIYPQSSGPDGIQVYCDVDSQGQAWTVFQRRTSSQLSFYRNWADFKEGFGDLCGDHWLGNEYLHQITENSDHGYVLRVDVVSTDDISFYADYRVSVNSEADGYRLIIHESIGDPADALFALKHNNTKFSTSDVDNDADINHCARNNKGGFWFSDCGAFYLNCDDGMFFIVTSISPTGSPRIFLKSSVMKLKRT